MCRVNDQIELGAVLRCHAVGPAEREALALSAFETTRTLAADLSRHSAEHGIAHDDLDNFLSALDALTDASLVELFGALPEELTRVRDEAVADSPRTGEVSP